MSLFEGIRPALKPLLKTPIDGLHAGLWLDRYLAITTFAKGEEPAGYDRDKAAEAIDNLIAKVDSKPLPPGYRLAWQRWRDQLHNEGPRVCLVQVESEGRVVVGIGQKNPAEFGITLHHTWGVPILPGSSLKGIAALGADRYFADEGWRRRPKHDTARKGGPNAYDALFGDVEEQGAVIFHDAWFVPSPDNRNGLRRDILTVHHPNYYQGESAFSDTESPIPVPFMTAKGKFLVALELHPDLQPSDHDHWLKAAWEALRLGLSKHGVGAKTNAGYGRFDLPAFDKTEFQKTLKAKTEEEEARKRQLARAERRSLKSAAELINDIWQDEGPAEVTNWLLAAGKVAITALEWRSDEHVSEVLIKILETTGTFPDFSQLAGIERERLKRVEDGITELRRDSSGLIRLTESDLQALVTKHLDGTTLNLQPILSGLQQMRADLASFQLLATHLKKLHSKGKLLKGYNNVTTPVTIMKAAPNET